MKFADSQQREDFIEALRRLRDCASNRQLQDSYADDLTLNELGERIAEIRNVEQVLVSIFSEREEFEREQK